MAVEDNRLSKQGDELTVAVEMEMFKHGQVG
jgi:hypothetical protein